MTAGIRPGGSGALTILLSFSRNWQLYYNLATFAFCHNERLTWQIDSFTLATWYADHSRGKDASRFRKLYGKTSVCPARMHASKAKHRRFQKKDARRQLGTLRPLLPGDTLVGSGPFGFCALCARRTTPGRCDDQCARRSRFTPGDNRIRDEGSLARKHAFFALGVEVACLHRAGLVHCDLTPYNIFVVQSAAPLHLSRQRSHACGVSPPAAATGNYATSFNWGNLTCRVFQRRPSMSFERVLRRSWPRPREGHGAASGADAGQAQEPGRKPKGRAFGADGCQEHGLTRPVPCVEEWRCDSG